MKKVLKGGAFWSFSTLNNCSKSRNITKGQDSSCQSIRVGFSHCNFRCRLRWVSPLQPTIETPSTPPQATHPTSGNPLTLKVKTWIRPFFEKTLKVWERRKKIDAHNESHGIFVRKKKHHFLQQISLISILTPQVTICGPFEDRLNFKHTPWVTRFFSTGSNLPFRCFRSNR